MKRFAIVAEYNPFHNGHALQIAQLRSKFGRSGMVILLSGYFCQRGEPALLSPYIRTQQALLNGADLVLRLPTITTLSSAEQYAQGAVAAIKALHLPNQAFGYEKASPEILLKAAKFLAEEEQNPSYLESLKANLHLGYAAARAKALAHCLPECGDCLNYSNQILAIEYLRANLQLPGLNIKPIFIQRHGPHHLDCEPEDQFASASSIRKFVRQPLNEELLLRCKKYMPVSSAALLLCEKQHGRTVTLADFTDELFTLLNRKSHACTRYLPIDLLNRMQRCCNKNDVEELSQLIEQSKSRQFPESRIQRSLCNLLLNIENTDNYLPQYLQVMGFNRDGRYLLRKLQENSDLPIISNMSELNSTVDPDLQRQYQQDRLACMLWTRKAGLPTAELLQKPLYIV